MAEGVSFEPVFYRKAEGMAGPLTVYVILPIMGRVREGYEDYDTFFADAVLGEMKIIWQVAEKRWGCHCERP
jgi:hypothetical protein